MSKMLLLKFLIISISSTELFSNKMQFAANFYKNAADSKNFLASCISIEAGLSLLLEGARNETAQEIKNLISKQSLKTALKLFRAKSENNVVTAEIALKLYTSSKFSLRKNFQENILTQGGSIETINFSSSDSAAKTINNWVMEHTRQKIQNLVNPSIINSETLLVLVNALYFKGDFENSFDRRETTKQNFNLDTKDTIQVDTMHSFFSFPFCNSQKLRAKFLELPFRGKNASMVFVLPNDNDLSLLEQSWDQIFDQKLTTDVMVHVSLPKFRIEQNIDLKAVLQKLGLGIVFTNNADFSGIAGRKGEVFLTQIIQKTFIDVVEEGVEAAAATEFEMISMASMQPPKEETFQADHPFLFYIKVRKIILFIGKLMNPSSAN